ncbi:hypothetical protein HHI36_015318 [Cryptolaemus montrouzieri]|uniref:Cytochrome P450 n=1 Tax=Cryptolaemus montrouzieri TaxID=559131 RepID=A0ABD2N5P0_9CUCU
MIAVLLLLGAITLLYFLAIKPFKYWDDRHVKTGKIWPVIKENVLVLLGKSSTVDMIKKIYNNLEGVRYIGVYQFNTPVLVLRSPEMIKQLCVKDSDHFVDHGSMFAADTDDLWSKNLLVLKGQHWRNMRATLSPSFTSSKMKSMFVLICNIADMYAQHFLKRNEEIVEIELKDALTRYTNDVIANTAFGIQVDSLTDRENVFYIMGRESTIFTGAWRKFKLIIFQVFPSIAKLLGLKILPDKVNDFFINFVKDTIKMREEQNIKRPDMLGLLIEARKGHRAEIQVEEIKEASFAVVEEHLKGDDTRLELTDIDIASQVFIFFFGGFETVSSAMCFMAHELASNPDVQRRLIEEIDENKPASGAPSYETIANMTYLDMVVTETLRKWPINIATDRVVTKPYTIEPELPGEQPVHLKPNDNIMIPIMAIHWDPQYYENPDKFDPERFSPDNRNNIDPYTYIPFGVGPRNCIGSRFALLEIKALFFYLLSHFEIIPVEKTNIPLKINKSDLNLTSENGFPLGLKRRN